MYLETLVNSHREYLQARIKEVKNLKTFIDVILKTYNMWDVWSVLLHRNSKVIFCTVWSLPIKCRVERRRDRHREHEQEAVFLSGKT